MKTVEKIRFSVAAQQAVKSVISESVGFDIWELDTNAPIRLGSFSKPLSKVLPSFYDAIEACRTLLGLGNSGDLLLRRHDWTYFGYPKNGWQVWGRRRDTGQRVATSGGGSRMPRKAYGSGKVYML